MYTLVLVRHGESQWNKKNLFTGWKDVDLSENGVEEAKNAGKLLKQHQIAFDRCYTSILRRAIKTLWLILEETEQFYLPVEKDWRLNERHYGALQGLNKKEMIEKHGEDQVHEWRRSFATCPPALEQSDPRYSEQKQWFARCGVEEVPLTESLELTTKRTIPYFEQTIAPCILSGERILIAAHGNSLRALVKHISNISDEEIGELNIPTGRPLVYKLDQELKEIERSYLE